MVDYNSGETDSEQSSSNEMADTLIQSTQLEHISKSRVKEFKTCPRSFYYTYIMGKRFDGNFYTKRGTRVHKAIELYYEEVESAMREGEFEPDNLMQYFPTERVGIWLDFVHPFLHNFLKFERRRWKAINHYGYDHEMFLPYAVEEEGRIEHPPVMNSPPWMGYADALLYSESVPGVEGDGLVIVDFKTGSVPDEKYRDDGIFLEGTFYRMLFEQEYHIDAVAGYYPKADELIVSPVSEERKQMVMDIVEKMINATSMDDFPTDPQPLCKWDNDNESQCDHYEYCSTRWGRGIGPSYGGK